MLKIITQLKLATALEDQQQSIIGERFCGNEPSKSMGKDKLNIHRFDNVVCWYSKQAAFIIILVFNSSPDIKLSIFILLSLNELSGRPAEGEPQQNSKVTFGQLSPASQRKHISLVSFATCPSKL